MPEPLPQPWRHWVEENLSRDPLCGAQLLLTLLEHGFHPLPSLAATGDVPLLPAPAAARGADGTVIAGGPASRASGRTTIHTAELCVLIASYRDPECAPTLCSLFRAASHPERIRVAVLSQEEPEEALLLPAELEPYASQIRIERRRASDSLGVCWARHHGQALLGAESFALQIDSHMRFEAGWDLLLLATWLHCRDPRALLSTYPAGYSLEGEIERGRFYGMAAKQFDAEGILLFHGRPCFQDGDTAPKQPLPAAFISANFLFGPAEFVQEVPYDPELYFFGEEVSLSVRLWTHGFNLFHPNRAIAYHCWDRSSRATHFDDHASWSERDRQSRARVRALLRVPPRPEDGVMPPFGRYGLGTARTLAAYESWSGIRFAEQRIAASAEQGTFPAPLEATIHSGARVLVQDEDLVVVDDFLPQQQYAALREFLVCSDYRHINSSGTISRAWHLQDRFPLRSETSWILPAVEPSAPKPDWVIPTGTPIDGFMQAVQTYQAQRLPWLGRQGQDWDEFSATAWIYPPGTGLAMHTDGANVYGGAYVYFLNDRWRSHWGGLLIVMDQSVNRAVLEKEKQQDGLRRYRLAWLHENDLEADLLEAGGLGRCVFPKANRIAFLGNRSYHMVTRVNEEAGDCVRLSLAGFFRLRQD